MDKSFNEDELSEIMKEIEAMEEEFKVDDAQSTNAVLQDLAQMEEKDSIHSNGSASKEVLSFSQTEKTSSAGAPATMSFKVQGDLKMDLSFEIGGKCVGITVSESGLLIKMDGGMTFTVPVTDVHKHKKAA